MVTEPTGDPFAAMLERATEDPPAALVDRLRAQARVDAASDSAATPVSTRRRFPRSATFALVAASLLLVVGAVVFAGGRDAGEPAVSTARDGNHLPTWWPEGFDSAVLTKDSDDVVPVNTREWLVSDQGFVAAQIMRIEGPAGDASSTATIPAGGSGRWTASFDVEGGTVLAVGRDVSGDGRHDAALQQMLVDDFELDTAPLPAGWRVVDDPDGVMTAVFTGRPLPGTATATASRVGTADAETMLLPQLMIMTIRTSSADQLGDALRLLAGPGQTPVEITPGRWGILVDQVTSTSRSAVWSPEPGVVVVVAGEEVGDGDLLAVARSTEPVQASRWARLAVPVFRELSESACEALAANPEGLRSVKDLNGFTQLGGSWTQVLGQSLFRLDDESLGRVAAAVAADDEGYDRLVEHLDDAGRRAFDTMRSIASDPARVRADAGDLDVARAAYTVDAVATQGCGFI